MERTFLTEMEYLISAKEKEIEYKEKRVKDYMPTGFEFLQAGHYLIQLHELREMKAELRTMIIIKNKYEHYRENGEG